VMTFVQHGAPMADLLREAAVRGMTVAYANRLLAALAGETADQEQAAVAFPGSSQPSLLEPLSEREMDVLRLLNSALSNREIADALYVSVNTVRTHVRNIYAKLDVHRRSQAVARAGKLGLL
jgi:LuxR family maltose regulon positive regulatory protein